MRRLVISITGTVICAVAAPALGQSKPLPEGRFTLFAGNDTAANFIVNSPGHRSGDVVEVITYRVYKDAIPTPSGTVDQDTTELEIDCARRTSRSIAVNAYRPDGRWAFSFPAEAATQIEPNQTWDFVARIVCDGVRLPDTAAVDGATAARAAGLARLR